MAFNGSSAIAGDGPVSKRLCTGKLPEQLDTGHNNNKVSQFSAFSVFYAS